MNKVTRHIITGICGVLLGACIVAAYILGTAARTPLKCEGLNVMIKDSLTNRFVSRQDIKTYLDKSFGTYIGQPLDSLDLKKVEDIIDRKSAVLKSQAYVTRDGMLNITVTQRKPVVRFQKADGGFYADAEGFIFPLQDNYASHVQIIDGAIPLKATSGHKGMIESPKERAWFSDMMAIVNFMNDSRTWKEKIVQIHVMDNGELVLIPRDGNEKFLFGQPDKIGVKFRKMEKYYTTILPEKGSNHYKWVDLRFDGQIVCR